MQTMEVLAARVRHAMETADLHEMGELLAPDARWGAPEQTVPTCRNALQILSWFEMARENGVRADITEVTIIDNNIVVGLKIFSNSDAKSNSNDRERWQVMSVEDGRIGEIRGYDKCHDATAYATSGVSHWKK